MKHLFFIAIAAVLFTSCKKYLDVNQNPNQPSSVSPDVVLTATEVQLGYTVGGADISLTTGILTQQITGVDRQFTTYNNYVFTADNFTNVWANMYDVMLNLYQLKQTSDEREFKFYSGISGVLLAYSLGITTDLWGDIPYSEAFLGEEGQYKPKYDTQQDIYATIDALLTEAIANLNTNPADAGLKPGADDVIYGGKVNRWIKFANSLKLRFLLHQSKLDPGVAGKIITGLNAAGGIISSNDDNAAVTFLDDEARANPLYQFFTQRDGYATFESHGSDMLESLNDERKTAYIGDDYSIGDYLGLQASPVILLSAAEVKFIEAEARAMSNDLAGAETAYNNGISLSFAQLGVSGADTYLAQATVAFATAPGTDVEKVINQKYLALYLQSEVYNDWRRTGFPVLTPNTVSSQIPRRYLYPQTELSYNAANVPSGITLASKIWWDK